MPHILGNLKVFKPFSFVENHTLAAGLLLETPEIISDYFYGIFEGDLAPAALGPAHGPSQAVRGIMYLTEVLATKAGKSPADRMIPVS